MPYRVHRTKPKNSVQEKLVRIENAKAPTLVGAFAIPLFD